MRLTGYTIAGNGRGNERGFALLTLMIFALIVTIAGLAFYAMASYETKSALDRQHSMEAFFLADAAVEQARGEVMTTDLTWRGPIPLTAMGSGTYELAAEDTTWNGESSVLLHAKGHVRNTDRGVDVFVKMVPSGELGPLLVNRDLSARGQIQIDGNVHINCDADFGNNDQHLGSGSYDSGYTIYPPPIFTEAALYENSTYYRVTGDRDTSGVRGDIEQYDHNTGNWNFVGAIDDSNVVSWSNQDNAYEFDFSGLAVVGPDTLLALHAYFDTYSGVFALDSLASHDYVVVNFSQENNPEPDVVADVLLHDPSNTFILEATVINTYFVGVDDLDRVSCNGSNECAVEGNTPMWKGGYITLRTKLTWKPRACITMVANDLGPRKGQVPNAQVSLGTADHPALTYICGTVQRINGDLDMYGGMIVLCDFDSSGEPQFYHDIAFVDCLPDYLKEAWKVGPGVLRFQEWREVAAY